MYLRNIHLGPFPHSEVLESDRRPSRLFSNYYIVFNESIVGTHLDCLLSLVGQTGRLDLHSRGLFLKEDECMIHKYQMDYRYVEQEDNGGYDNDGADVSEPLPIETDTNCYDSYSQTGSTQLMDNRERVMERNSLTPVRAASGDTMLDKVETPYRKAITNRYGACRGMPIDWNDEFQKILALPENTEDEKLHKYSELSSLNKDFVHIAKTFGKIIISERYLHAKHRTINPTTEVGGVAGGEKYVYHGILFKFAIDWRNLYGGDHNAMKAANHELQAVTRYYECEGISVPLMTLIEYRGYRLVAMSWVPITSRTLVYGSQDGGYTVLASDEKCNRLMQMAGKRLNLKGHYAGLRPQTSKFIYGPCDIEGHLNENHFYVLDFARVFPPVEQKPNGPRNTYLYQLFRPEFVRRLEFPLSSDAFSTFGHDNNIHEEDIRRATRQLHQAVVQFAQMLDRDPSLYNELRGNLTERLHRSGINCRLLGMLRHNVKSTAIRSVILEEMISRVIKNHLRAKLRSKMEKLKTLAEYPYKMVILDLFQTILGSSGRSVQSIVDFWFHSLKEELESCFERGLNEEEKEEDFDLRNIIDIPKLFDAVQKKTGVKLTKQSRVALEKNPRDFSLVISDIRKASCRVKSMNVVSLAEGNALALQSIIVSKSEGGEISAARLFTMAMSKFEEAICQTPDSRGSLNNYADILVQLAVTAGDQSHDYFATAVEKYTVAENASSLLHLGDILHQQQLSPRRYRERFQLMDLEQRCYKQVLKMAKARLVRRREEAPSVISVVEEDRDDLFSSNGLSLEDPVEEAGTAINDSMGVSRPSSTRSLICHTLLMLADYSLRKAKQCNSYEEWERAGKRFRKAGRYRDFKSPTGDIYSIFGDFNEFPDAEVALLIEALLPDRKWYSLGKLSHTDSLIPNRPFFIDDETFDARRVSFSKMVTGSFLSKMCHRLSSSSVAIRRWILKGCWTTLEGNKLGADESDQIWKQMSHTNVTELDVEGAYCEHLFHLEKKGPYHSFINDRSLRNFIRLPGLERLDLSKLGKSVSDLTLEDLANSPSLTSLKYLNLSGGRYHTDAVIQFSQHFRQPSKKFNITHLNLSHLSLCRTLDPIVPIMERLGRQLISLSLDGYTNGGENAICQILSACISLTSLSLVNVSQLKDNSFIYLKGRHLRYLDISGTGVTLGGLQPITSSRDLVKLSLQRCRQWTDLYQPPDQLPHLDLSDWPNLEELDLAHTSHNQIQDIQELTKLRRLSLYRCELDVDTIHHIVTHSSKTLQDLDLGGISQIDDVIMEKIAQSGIQYRRLSFNGCKNITSDGVLLLCDTQTELRALILNRCNHISDDAVIAICNSMKFLEELRIRNSKITNEGGQKILSLNLLRILDIRDCQLITSITGIPRDLPSLETLLIDGCTNFSDETLLEMSSMKKMRHLYMTECPRITDAVLHSITSHFEGLKTVDMGGNKFSKGEIQRLKEARPDLRINVDRSLTSSQTVTRTPSSSSNALKVLMSNMSEISENPNPLISASPVDDDLFHWHVNLIPSPGSPYAGGLYHIELEFPKEFPREPPSARVISGETSSGERVEGNSDYQEFFERKDRKAGRGKMRESDTSVGWSSAYSVQTILVQLQHFLSNLEDVEGALETYLSQIPNGIKTSRDFQCNVCGHTFHKPFPPFEGTTSKPFDQSLCISELDSIRSALRCYHLRLTHTEDVLGYGVVSDVHRNVIRSVSSPLEFLSHTAFQDGVKQSIMRDVRFNHWLPLFITNEHAKRARPLFEQYVSSIYRSEVGDFKLSTAVELLCKLMNNVVVDLMNGTRLASTKCLEGYCAFHRLLIMCIAEDPSLQIEIDRRISAFIEDERQQHKKVVPNLGEFIPLLLVSNYNWKDIAESYVREVFDRNVLWLLKAHPKLNKSQYDPEIDAERNDLTFKTNHVSLRLLLFHVYFLRLHKPANKSLEQIAEQYDSLFGHPTEDMKNDLLSVVKQIMAVDSWDEFFTIIAVPIPSERELNAWLRKSVLNSVNKGYHDPTSGQGMPIHNVCNSFLKTGKCNRGIEHRDTGGLKKAGNRCKFTHVTTKNEPTVQSHVTPPTVIVTKSIVKPNISYASIASPTSLGGSSKQSLAESNNIVEKTTQKTSEGKEEVDDWPDATQAKNLPRKAWGAKNDAQTNGSTNSSAAPNQPTRQVNYYELLFNK
ncbi:hypothetical protein PROFUN_13876 [Planoprotostelium fungivorum]|uniref:UBC core domain-containing protein n=1 Tax=Planoprotostelium fungivorum TaxID=1890364 RepID=A0A2P6N2S8_9EUKA|nr:hypothetical protein PROFUN_13876 [Planoprotostelium fungivorum]